MPLVSVLMTSFNRESMVADAIRSIQNQTFQDWELVILDDASTDNTLRICRDFEAHDKRIRVFANSTNVGLGETRKRLMSLATGKYIANQDSDDLSVPERLAWEVELLETLPEIGLVTGVVAFVDDHGVFGNFPQSLLRGELYPQDKKEMVKLLYQDCIVQIAACMFRAPLAHFFPGKYRIIDDWHFLLHVAHRERIWGIPKVLVHMNRGGGHNHLWKDPDWTTRATCEFLGQMYRYYKNDPASPIDFSLYRKAMAPWLVKRGLHLGGWKGYGNILQALIFDPSNEKSWASLIKVSRQHLKKLKRLLVPFPLKQQAR